MLILPIKKKWFNMIASGIKKEDIEKSSHIVVGIAEIVYFVR